MAGGYPVGNRAAPLFVALAAALSVALLLLVTPTACAADQHLVIISNSSLCSDIDGDGGGVDGGCFTIGQAQPELEGFEMSVDLGSGGVFRRSLGGGYSPITKGTQSKGKPACGRDKQGHPYHSCTTDAKNPPYKDPCSAFKRGNPCPS